MGRPRKGTTVHPGQRTQPKRPPLRYEDMDAGLRAGAQVKAGTHRPVSVREFIGLTHMQQNVLLLLPTVSSLQEAVRQAGYTNPEAMYKRMRGQKGNNAIIVRAVRGRDYDWMAFARCRAALDLVRKTVEMSAILWDETKTQKQRDKAMAFIEKMAPRSLSDLEKKTTVSQQSEENLKPAVIDSHEVDMGEFAKDFRKPRAGMASQYRPQKPGGGFAKMHPDSDDGPDQSGENGQEPNVN